MWGTTEFICAYRVSAAGQVCTWGREQKTNAHRRRPIRVKAASPWLDARVFVFSSVRANQIERKKVRKKLNFFSSSFFFFCSKRFVWFFERRDVSVSLVGFFRLHVGSLFFLSFLLCCLFLSLFVVVVVVLSVDRSSDPLCQGRSLFLAERRGSPSSLTHKSAAAKLGKQQKKNSVKKPNSQYLKNTTSSPYPGFTDETESLE